MRSGIYDKHGIEVKIGDTLVFPYVTPIGDIDTDTVDFEATVIFAHGAYGYMTKVAFIPLFAWSKVEHGEYIPNHGEKRIILDIYPFFVKQ